MSDWNVTNETTVEADACFFYNLVSLNVKPKINSSSFKIITA